MTERSPGAVLDPLGVTLDLDEDQQITDVLIIAKVVRYGDDPRTALVIASNPGSDWITQAGLLAAAQHFVDHDVAGQVEG